MTERKARLVIPARLGSRIKLRCPGLRFAQTGAPSYARPCAGYCLPKENTRLGTFVCLYPFLPETQPRRGINHSGGKPQACRLYPQRHERSEGSKDSFSSSEYPFSSSSQFSSAVGSLVMGSEQASRAGRWGH